MTSSSRPRRCRGTRRSAIASNRYVGESSGVCRKRTSGIDGAAIRIATRNSAAMTHRAIVARQSQRARNRDHRKVSNVFWTRSMRSAPMLTAASRIIPSNRGCNQRGDVEHAEEKRDHAQDQCADMEPIAPPVPPRSEVPPITTEAMEVQSCSARLVECRRCRRRSGSRGTRRRSRPGSRPSVKAMILARSTARPDMKAAPSAEPIA